MISYAEPEKPIFLPDNPTQKTSAPCYNKPLITDDFVKSFYNKKIDVGIEINNYFSDEKPIPVDLQDCLFIAMKNNLNLKIARAKECQYKWEDKNRLSKFLPQAYYNYMLYNLNGNFLSGLVIPADVNETGIQSNFYLNWTLFDGGYNFFKKKAAKNLYNSSQKEVEFSKEEVLKKTATSYYKVLANKLKIETMTRNLIEAEAQLIINQKKENCFDITRAEAEAAKAKQKLSEAYQDYRSEQANLANILGVEVASSIYPSENEITPKALIDKNIDIEKLSQMAYQTRPDIEALQLKIKALENERKTLYAPIWPNLQGYGLLGNVGTSGRNLIESRAIGINLIQNFGTNFYTGEYTSIKKYDAIIEEAKLTLQNKYRDIEQNIISSYYSVRTSKERMDEAKNQLKSADKGLEMTFARVNEDKFYTDALQVRTAKTDANVNLINATTDYNIAQINILFNTGAISVYNLTQDSEK